MNDSHPRWVQAYRILRYRLGRFYRSNLETCLMILSIKKSLTDLSAARQRTTRRGRLNSSDKSLSSKKRVDEIAEKIRARLLDWHNNRALQLGENSAVKLTNEMTRKAAKKKGYRVIWQVMSGSPCQFCATLNGVTVDAGDTFHSTKKGA